jgi:hypothetical protein
VGSIERRIEELEVRYGVGTGQFTPHHGDERELVTSEALQRLTRPEFAILRELMELREQHPDLNGAEFFGLMTDVHHAMEREWVRVVRGVLGDRIEESDETRERKEELQRRADEAIRPGEIPERGL